MPPGLVTAAIPVYNGEKYLAEAIESVLSQTYEPIELIVVDDGSTDRSSEVVERYTQDHDVTLIRREENAGQAVARNAAIKAARGAYWTSLDSDDMMTPDRIEKQVRQVEEEGGEFVLTLEEILIEPGVPDPPLITGKRAPISTREDVYQTMSFLAPMEVIHRIGPFDETLRYGEDIDYCLRAFDAGCRVIALPEYLTIRRFHGANMTYDMQQVRGAMFAAVRRRIGRHRSGATLRAGSATDGPPPTEG
jgi:glycosyltransferase involved in cell wall biosynthesis